MPQFLTPRGPSPFEAQAERENGRLRARAIDERHSRPPPNVPEMEQEARCIARDAYRYRYFCIETTLIIMIDFGIEYEINNFTPKNTDALSVTAVPRSPESVSQVTGQVGVYPGHYADVRRIREADTSAEAGQAARGRCSDGHRVGDRGASGAPHGAICTPCALRGPPEGVV